jgi:hypothetical protein
MIRLASALVMVSALLLGGCSDDDSGSDDQDSADVVAGTAIEGASDDDPDKVSDPADGLTFTRAVGTTYELHDAIAECIDDPEHPGTEVVRLTSPAKYEKIFVKGRITKPYFYVQALPGTKGRADLPLSGGDESTAPPVAVFGVDSADQNELSGDAEVATGSIVVLEATCDPEPRLSFTILATLGSELGMPPMHVAGGLAATGKA